MGRATEKDWPKRPSDSQPQGGLKKGSDRAVTPAVEAGCVPACLARPSSCATFTLNSHQGRAATGRRILASVHAGSLRWSPTLCDPVDCGLPGFSVREGGSPGRNTGAYWPILVAIPFWSTIFPAALASNPLEYLMLPEPLQPKQLHHCHTWPSQGQTQVLQGSLRSKPQWTTLIQRWK